MANFRNFAYGAVLVAPTPPASGTTLRLALGQGLRFPAVPFKLAVWPQVGMPDPNNAEIVTVTAVVGDDLTVQRGQEGSTLRAIVAGDQVAAALTKAFLDQIPLRSDPSVAWAGDIAITGGLTVAGLATLHDLHVLGNAVVDGTTDLKGAVTIESPATIASAIVSGSLDVQGLTALHSNAAITGNADVSGALHAGSADVTGNLTVGGALVGVNVQGYREQWQTGVIAGDGKVTVDYRLGNHIVLNLTANVTGFIVTNVPAYGGGLTAVASLHVFFIADGTLRTVAHTINGTAVRFPGALTFPMSSGNGKEDRILYTTWSGGTLWLGDVVGQNY